MESHQTEECFGREAVLALLKKRVLDLKDGYRQNVALLGHPYVGKSALLHHFVSYLKDEQVMIVYLDLEHPDFDHFARKLSFNILSQYARHHNMPALSELNVLLESLKKMLPQTTAVIQDILKHICDGKRATAFAGLLTLPEIFSNETGCFCVMMIDEFQNLETFEIPQLFQKLGKKIMTQTKCFYVLASSYPQRAKKILSEDLSLLFGNFEVIELEPLDAFSSRRCLETGLGEHPMSEELKNFLIDFCAGYPLYLQILCRELTYLSMLHQQKEIFVPLVSQAVENAVFDRWGIISRHFELKMMELSDGKASRVMVDILFHLADGCNKRETLSEKLGVHNTALKTKLQRLIDQGLIAKNGDFYYFKDKLFRYWIKFVYARRFKALDWNGSGERTKFRDDFQNAFALFGADASRNPALRVMDLLHAMDEGSLELGGRRYHLSQFRDVVPLALQRVDGKPLQTLKATSSEQNWLIALNDSCVEEEDVNSFLEEIKKKGRKPLKCVIIALDRMDEQAKLKALEEKCWIWHREELNALLGLFDKPGI